MRFAQPQPFFNPNRKWPQQTLGAAPRWCAVDLRDGNQALPNPLTPPQKLEYYNLLLKTGFQEIEIGFPAASQEDWQFCRMLIEKKLIPDHVTISVLSQARPHIIRRTLEALNGAEKAIFHLYIATSDLHVTYVLGSTQAEILRQIRESVDMIKTLSQELCPKTHLILEFSPEEFTDSDLDFTLRLSNTVIETWQPNDGEKVIINLPSTVERALPLRYADMIEAFSQRMKYRSKAVLSLHAHNDMGCAVADTELALLAGGERVEGTLFGNGERAGNVDLITLALNLQYLGLDTGLFLDNLEELAAKVAELTSIPVSPRQPYAGALAFTAFSGSHQDAIAKGFRREHELIEHFGAWKLPYLHIDPAVIGREYQEFIRINSQSGKGGIAHVLKQNYHIELPMDLLSELTQAVQLETETREHELTPADVWNVFLREFVHPDTPLKVVNFWPRPDKANPAIIRAEVHAVFQDSGVVLKAIGDGPVAAFAAALRKLPLPDFLLKNYEERSIGTSVNAQSITIVKLDRCSDGQPFFGIGFGANIVQGAAQAIVSSINRMLKA